MGRPKLTEDAKRRAFSISLTPALRNKLEIAAETGGRSLSQEVESRLERSFAREKNVWGGPHIERLMKVLAVAVQSIEESTGKRWTEDDGTRKQLVAALPAFAEAITKGNSEYFRTGVFKLAPEGPSPLDFILARGEKK